MNTIAFFGVFRKRNYDANAPPDRQLPRSTLLISGGFIMYDDIFESIRYEAENVVCLELLDTIVSAGRKEEIVDLLKEVYSERFHIPAEIRVDYKEPDRTGSREYDEKHGVPHGRASASPRKRGQNENARVSRSLADLAGVCRGRAPREPNRFNA